jgi:hypothetical protein
LLRAYRLSGRPLAIEPANDALGHAPRDALEIAATWRIGSKEARSAIVDVKTPSSQIT